MTHLPNLIGAAMRSTGPSGDSSSWNSKASAPAPPTAAEVLAAAVRAAGSRGVSRREISQEVFTCNKTRGELDAIMAEVLAQPGFGTERRRTVGTHSAKFLIYDEAADRQLF